MDFGCSNSKSTWPVSKQCFSTPKGASRSRLTYDLRKTTPENVFSRSLGGGPQVELTTLLEFDPEVELTRCVWRALPDDVEAEEQYQLAQWERDKRRARGKAKVARGTTRGARRSAYTPKTFFEMPVAWRTYGRYRTTGQERISFQHPRKQHS